MVYDELDLPWGTLRIRPKGSAAGHNGMKSVIAQLGHAEFCAGPRGSRSRQRVGAAERSIVLAPFKRAQKQEVEETAGRAAEAVESILAEGVEKSMAIFNRRAQGLKQEEE